MSYFPGPYEFYYEHGIAGIRMQCPEDCPNHTIHQTHELITPQHMRADVGNLNNREEFRATWQLMAAAPDLLAALERIAVWDFNVLGDCVADAQALAKAAIKKAQGLTGIPALEAEMCDRVNDKNQAIAKLETKVAHLEMDVNRLQELEREGEARIAQMEAVEVGLRARLEQIKSAVGAFAVSAEEAGQHIEADPLKMDDPERYARSLARVETRKAVLGEVLALFPKEPK